MTIKPWKVTNSRYLIRDRWMTLRADRCETAGGVVIEPYYVQEPQDWVQVVAFDTHDRILVTRQYRHAAGIVSAELPCGTVEPGESPVEALERELLEETGCAFDELRALPVLSPNPARFANKIHAFIATGVHPIQPPRADATEVIEFDFLPIPAVLALIDAGEFPQALHIATVLLALRTRQAPICV